MSSGRRHICILPASHPRRAYGGSSDGDQPPQLLPYLTGAHYRDRSSYGDQPPQQLPYLAGAHDGDNNVIIFPESRTRKGVFDWTDHTS